jgi:hypothetical protein
MPTVLETSWSGRLPSSKNELIAKVCALYGFSTSDTDFNQRAVEWLDDAIKDLNHNVWESTKVAESGIVMTAAQQWINLNTTFYKESQAYLVNNTSGDQPPMKFLPWVHFKRLYGSTDTNNTSRPYIYTVFNEQRDSKVYLFPIPDTTTVADFTLAVEYYQRLPLISTLSGSDSPEIPEEFENVILFGAYKRAAMHLGETDKVKLYSGLEAEALERMKRVDSMRPDADRRFRLVDGVGPSAWWVPNQIWPY